MTTFLLIRHATHDLVGRSLAGRAPYIHLNSRGQLEAERLAERLTGLPVHRLYTSPMERAQETAWPLANMFRLPLRVHGGVDEINFGDWTCKTFTELDPLPDWQEWNANRSRARCPGGESMQEVQERMVRTLNELAKVHPGEHVAIVSHGDVIKAALMQFLGIPLDNILRFEISPASVSMVNIHEYGAQVLLINDTGELSGPHRHDHGLNVDEPVPLGLAQSTR